MKFYYSLLITVTLGVVGTQGVVANDPYEGLYEVNRIDARRSAFEYVPGEIIVKFKAESSGKSLTMNGKRVASPKSSAVNNLLEKYGVNKAEELMPLTGTATVPMQKRAKAFNGESVKDADLSSLYLIQMDASKINDIHSAIEDFKNLDEVEYAEPNYIVYACASSAGDYVFDPLYSQQWGPAAIGLDKLWDVPLTSSKRPVIAILDTGVDIEHPDLADNIWTNTLEAEGVDGKDDDHNGFYDDIHGWDFINNTAKMRDNNGHGTHCAGIAAAVGGNGIGIVGANPEALIMPVTILQSNGQGDIATIIKGIDYAVANGADIISMSFGGYYDSMAEKDALGKAYQKAILVAAAGNDNLCIYPHKCPINQKVGTPMYPAAYKFVLGVEASSNANGSLASFSNFDEDGPITSTFADLENYELRAPGTGILSTFPNGQYKQLNGTSMACPLVAGAISRLISTKEISNKEELFGDLIASTNGNLNIFNAYNILDADRKPTLSLVTYRLDDVKMGDGDGRPDAGETIRFYPTLRNNWGYAKNITYSLEVAENEDPDIVEFIDGAVKAVSNLSNYASIEGETPVLIKINPDCADGRKISLVFTAICDNISAPLKQQIVFDVNNGIELGGIIENDMTLSSDKNYLITSPIAIPDNVTMTIEPGTTVYFKDGTGIGISTKGQLIAEGQPGKPITFTKADGSLGKVDDLDHLIVLSPNSKLEYCIFKDLISRWSILKFPDNRRLVKRTIFSNTLNSHYWNAVVFDGCCFYDNRFWNDNLVGGFEAILKDCNFINNTIITRKNSNDNISSIASYSNNNIFSNNINLDKHSIVVLSSNPRIISWDTPSYIGSSNENIIRHNILDINDGWGYGQLNVSTIAQKPSFSAPGIVWKVVVNEYDAQDEFELLPPLGVGKHKFEVYFSKPMNHEKTPMIAMGVRDPYTQIAISEDGNWRSETMENGEVIDIYTAYLTIKGKDNFDGLNTIYVADAEDEEFFPIPIEDVRFHVNVQSAGSMSTGFVAEPGVGKVTLIWDNPEDNFDDMLGYNLYRYTLNENDEPNEAVRINETLLDTEEFVDYDIIPGTTYCYYYKVLRTSMDENAPSRVVSATPRAAGKGDANGSGNVDVADVVTEVNYMVGREPKPFIFDAADVNDDTEVDILDVVGTVNIIMSPNTQANMASIQSTATYSIKDGILYVDTPVELAGIQVALNGNRNSTEIKVLEGLKGMETTGEWMSEDEYKFISFSLSGKTLMPGKTALLSIGDAEVMGITLVDANAKEVMAIQAGTNGISSIVMVQMDVPSPNPFTESLNVPVVIGAEGSHSVELALVNLAGTKVYSVKRNIDYGKHTVTLTPRNIPSGFYMLTMTVDGNLVQSSKVIKK
ncbi:MAG: S8 family serine peptidase [Muribaculaceae bacterium]|nr:S8 family serine peptidase [Muribaculaceae bacterium]